MTLIPVTPELSRNEQRAKLLKSLRIPLIIVSLLGVMALIIFLAAPQRSDDRFAPDNPGPQGARALAQVLQNQGVSITYATQLVEIEQPATADSTLLIATDQTLPADHYTALLNNYSRVVVLDPDFGMLEAATEATGEYVGHAGGFDFDGTVSAQCSLPAAIAAERITSNGLGLEAGTDWDEETGQPVLPQGFTGCFPLDYGWHLIQGTAANGTVMTFVDDMAMFTNELITDDGHAALALHLLGEDETLVWYIPEKTPTDSEGVSPTWPMAFTLSIFVALVSAVLFALWRGRRMGPIISEDLPVIVKASESVRGRGKLYRAGKSHAHSAGALRAGTASRLGARLGLPQSSPSTAFIAAASAATGRDEKYIHELFYGPAPTNDVDLTTLAQRLSDLESEIHA